MESLILKQSPPELLLEDVSCKRLILDSEPSVCPCTHSLSQPSPLALFRQNWGCECPAVNPSHQGSSLLIWAFRGNTLAGLCLSWQYRAQTEDEQSWTAGSPACAELMVSVREVPGGCSPRATPRASAESQCAARCLEPNFSPLFSLPTASSLADRLECRKHPNQKHRQGSLPVCSCLASQKEGWIPCIWWSRCRQSLYWQN